MIDPAYLGIAAVGFVLAAVIVVAAVRHPRATLVVLILVPLVDRYVYSLLVPERLQALVGVIPESLVFVATLTIAVDAWRSGRLLPALRHPIMWLALAFVALAAVSAVVNGVEPVRAILGIAFTVDAVAVFFLPRAVGFEVRVSERAARAFLAVVVIASLVAVAQVVISPRFLSLAAFEGRFGEGMRPGAFFSGQPNLLGAVVGMTMPLACLAALLPQVDRRRRVAAGGVAFLLALVLIYTFSRGTWVGLLVAVIVTGLAVERRLILVVPALFVLAFVTALVLPRGLALSPEERDRIDYLRAIFGRMGEVASGGDLRFKFIENALPIIEDHPVLGTGPGTYGGAVASHLGSPLYDTYTAGVVPVDRTVDNYWLHALVEFGFAGAALLIAMLLAAIAELLRAARRSTGVLRVLFAGWAAAAVVLGVTSLTEMLLEGNTTSVPLWFFLGVGSALAVGVGAGVVPAPEASEVAPGASIGTSTP